MFRWLVFVGVVIGVAVAVPALNEAHPDLLPRLLGQQAPSESEPAPMVALAEKAKPEQPLGRKVLLERDGAGHYQAEFRFNGRNVPAMVDTGATTVAINATTARRIGISLKPADFKYEVRTANGTVKAARAMIDEVQIGRIRVDNVEAAVLDDRALAGTLVGMSFLNRISRFNANGDGLLLEQ